jgi:hypothetical protein
MINHLAGPTRVRRESEHLFIGNNEVHAVQNAQLSYDVGAGVLKYIGMSCAQVAPVAASQANVSITTLAILNDQFINFTGNSGVNGYLFWDVDNNRKNFGFISGYLTSYRSRCSIGQIPIIDTSFNVYGNAGNIQYEEIPQTIRDFDSLSGHHDDFHINIAGPGSLSISLDDFETNRVLSYDLSIAIQRQPRYIIGQRRPYKVEVNYPIQVDCTFTFDIDGYTPKSAFDFPMRPTVKDLTISLNNYLSGNNVIQYSFSDLFLVSEGLSASTDSNLSNTYTYRTFLTR